MIRIAQCGTIDFTEGDLGAALAGIAFTLDLEAPRIETFSSPTELVDACADTTADDQPIDLIISGFDLPGITGLQVAAELKDLGLFDDGLRFVLCAPNGSRAADAAHERVSAFLVEPLTLDDLTHSVTPLLRELDATHQASAVLRCREGLHRIAFSQVAYVETTGRDQTIHRERASKLSVRCSSRALFGHLADDGRFYKLGSSYIVNLDYVDNVSMRTGMVTLIDGTEIPAPVRLRTELADAICAHAAVSV